MRAALAKSVLLEPLGVLPGAHLVEWPCVSEDD